MFFLIYFIPLPFFVLSYKLPFVSMEEPGYQCGGYLIKRL